MGANNDCALISESRTDNLFLMFRRGPGAKSAKREYAWRNCPRAPQPPQHYLSEAPTRQPRLFFVLSGFHRQVLAPFRGSFRIALTQNGIAVPGTELIGNERTNWTAVALILRGEQCRYHAPEKDSADCF